MEPGVVWVHSFLWAVQAYRICVQAGYLDHIQRLLYAVLLNWAVRFRRVLPVPKLRTWNLCQHPTCTCLMHQL
jgi:hypothetical protein